MLNANITPMTDALIALPEDERAQVFVDFVASVIFSSNDSTGNWNALKHAIEDCFRRHAA